MPGVPFGTTPVGGEAGGSNQANRERGPFMSNTEVDSTTERGRGEPRIVVGVDGSDGSQLALRWALRLARTEAASVEVVGAWDIAVEAGWTVIPADYSPEKDIAAAVDIALDRVLGDERPSNLRVHIRQGHPVRVLLGESADALMLVVGSRGRGGFKGLLLGSVSARVAELASCPVLVVHGDDVPAP